MLCLHLHLAFLKVLLFLLLFYFLFSSWDLLSSFLLFLSLTFWFSWSFCHHVAWMMAEVLAQSLETSFLPTYMCTFYMSEWSQCPPTPQPPGPGTGRQHTFWARPGQKRAGEKKAGARPWRPCLAARVWLVCLPTIFKARQCVWYFDCFHFFHCYK